MKSTYFSIALTFGSATAYSVSSRWSAPGPNDVRAPCPMLNALANHGFLPHDGKSITENKTVAALGSALNIDQELASFLFGFAVTTNPKPNATTFDLNHLSRHNVLEHDASLSRKDAHFGAPDIFDEAVFNQTRAYWTGDIIDIQMAANARVARLMTSNLTNPEFSLSQLGDDFSIGETAAYIAILGDRKAGTVPKSWVEYLFENERLPYELGFAKKNEAMTLDALVDMIRRIRMVEQLPK
ncbi:Cloroperoxidase [Hypomontagnella monticulosa]|nr:Cloroperoxidase [Hypomontagnella monticulosa]